MNRVEMVLKLLEDVHSQQSFDEVSQEFREFWSEIIENQVSANVDIVRKDGIANNLTEALDKLISNITITTNIELGGSTASQKVSSVLMSVVTWGIFFGWRSAEEYHLVNMTGGES